MYDVRRFIPPYLLTKVWSEFKDVRFIQASAAEGHPAEEPGLWDLSRPGDAGLGGRDRLLERQIQGGQKLIPKQVFDATYIVNLALLKAHSYPYNTMEDGDSGQTAVTMCGKNHFGSIKGTWELHSAINTDQEGVKNAYSPIVDLAASPNLGAKTILFVLDGLYSGRKWQHYPQHFPNPPFNNRAEPYENPDWPASVLASMDGVALDSVGLDILFAQTRNNNDANGHPRILIRANADDYLFEMAQADYRRPGRHTSRAGKRSRASACMNGGTATPRCAIRATSIRLKARDRADLSPHGQLSHDRFSSASMKSTKQRMSSRWDRPACSLRIFSLSSIATSPARG